MKKLFKLTPLKFKKLRELLVSRFGFWVSMSKGGEIRHGKNMFAYIFRPKRTPILEFCITDLSTMYNIKIKSDYTIDDIIDIAYTKFILGEYNMSNHGADFKFNTIRNVLRYHFKTKEYMINHYSGKLSIPIINLLKKEFADKDLLNIVVPERISILTRIREFESGIIDHVRKEFNLMRAGPDNIRSPLILVA